MSTSRRIFIAGAVAGAASAASLKPSPSLRSTARALGANDRINAAVIGVGGNGFGMLRTLLARQESPGDVRVAAVSDIYTRRKDRAREAAKLESKDVHHDYRELLARPDVDMVVISVPDHWHAQMAIDSMAAGKDVYLQKPMTLTIGEARQVSEAASKLGRVLQVGSQHLSDKRYHKAKELIEGGEIGDVLWAQGTYSRNSIDGEWNYYVEEEASPETIDWTRWLGSAPKRAFSPERYFRWRKYWDYSGGIATDLFYHKLGPLLYAMGPQFPTRVTGSGGVYVQKDREVPDTYATVIEYPKFYVNLSSSMANAAAGQHFADVIYGQKGTITFGGSSVTVTPEPVWNAKVPEARRGRRKFDVAESNQVPDHVANLLDCMRSRKQPVLNPEFGFQLMTAIRLGVDSYREGKVKCFDARTRRVVDKPVIAREAFEGDGKNRPDGRKRRG